MQTAEEGSEAARIADELAELKVVREEEAAEAARGLAEFQAAMEEAAAAAAAVESRLRCEVSSEFKRDVSSYLLLRTCFGCFGY